MASMAREGSGTSWLPDATPMFMVHRQRGPWMLMAHENLFVQFLKDSGDRGDDQVGSINWVMGMAERSLGRARLALRGMFSAEPWTIRGCGYPDLLASGEECAGEAIHDRQHPHDLAMEISARYDAPLRGAVRWEVYGGPSAEPALGPVAYPHRVSAGPNPIAPISHHWLDSTHVSFGVVTAGVYGARWKAETSVFNGREPDDQRKDFDFGPLDSVAGRLSFLPTENVALQVSAGHLNQAESGEAGEPRVDVDRVTASATFHHVAGDTVSASTFAWGRNSESAHATNALLVETSLIIRDRDVWFGRLEAVQKTPHDLEVEAVDERFAVSKVQVGYTRYARVTNGFNAGVGASVSAGIVPGDLAPFYGGRVNPGIAVFVTVRPAATGAGASATAATRTMVMVQTAYDPSKLTCPAGFDPSRAPSTIYDGRTYYFCSTEDRDRFLTDPQMSLSMMPPKQ
jgi:YHS domain-containing protein